MISDLVGEELNYCLEMCPNLEHVIYEEDYYTIDVYHDEDEDELDPLSPGPYQLRQLTILCDATDLNIADLISRCPHLESFHFYCRHPNYKDQLSHIIPALLEHCPNLHTVEISSKERSMFIKDQFSWISAKAHHDIGCSGLLHKLIMHADLTTHAMDGLRKLIGRSKTSLEKLDVGNMQSGTMLFQALITAQLINLRELSCTFAGDQTTIAQLKAQIELSPRLERVFISHFGISDAVLSSLEQLCNLIELRFCVDSPVTYNGLASLLSQSPSLQDIDLHHNYQRSHLSMYDIIRALAACRSLQKLRLSSNAWDQLTETQAAQLEREIQSHQSGLQQAKLVCFSDSGKSSLRPWSGFRQLQQLDIQGQCDSVTAMFTPIIPWEQAQGSIRN